MTLERILHRAEQSNYVDLHIVNNTVVGFYKTTTVKYVYKSGYVESNHIFSQ